MDLDEFEEIDMSGNLKIQVRPGPQSSVTILGGDEEWDDIRVRTTQEGQLIIKE